MLLDRYGSKASSAEPALGTALRLRGSENPAELGAAFWKSRRLVLVVTLKVLGMWQFLFARGGLDRRRAVVAAAIHVHATERLRFPRLQWVALTVALFVALGAPAQAQTGGQGGGNNNSGVSCGGAAGVSSATTIGGVGGNGGCSNAGGGGGGAGTTGGRGGTSPGGSAGGAGGVLGVNAGAGAAGANSNQGGGGGGGAQGLVVTTNSILTTSVTGGNGGAGGNGLGDAGGGGGAGGYGVVVENGANATVNAAMTGGHGGAGGTSQNPFGANGGDGGFGVLGTSGATITNNFSITGGNGGAGGINVGCCPALGGNGGNGAAAVSLISGGTLVNSATIIGGNGGAGGNNTNLNNTAPAGNGGNGGAGVTGANAIITNSGTISGGVGSAAGTGINNGLAGTSGEGISGSDLTIINRGSISGASGANAITFTGGINTLTLQAGSTIAGNVVASGVLADNTFALGGTANSSFNVAQIGSTAQYQGFGVFQKSGSSTWTLIGTNTAALPWSVNVGTLMVNGTIANSPMTVNAGGTLAGIGTVGNTTINGGTLSPGNSIGLLTVQGSLVLTAASSYLVEVSPANADRTNVTGSATLGGATVNASFAAGTYVAKQYTILNATGGLGGNRFGSIVNTNLPGGFKSSLSYDGSNAFLNLALDFTPTPTPNFGGGLNGNQQAVGNALINFFNTTGGIPLVFGALTPTGLTQVSGETAVGSQQTTFNAMSQFMGVMTDPFIAGRGDPISGGGNPNAYAEEGSLAYAAKRKPGDALAAIYTKAPPIAPVFEQRWSVWAAGYGGSQRTDGNTIVGSNDTRSSIAAGAVGADYRISPNTLAGFALAGGGTNFSVNGFGNGRSDLFQAGAFIRHNVGAAYLSGALAYGWQDITTDRTVTIAGIDQLRARFNANAWSGRIEGGYRFVAPVIGGVGFTPYAAGQFATFELPAYAEGVISGANTFALAYGAKSVTDTRSELGLRTDKSFAMQSAILTLRGRLAWAHDFNPDRGIGATFLTLPGASFFVNGAAQASESALVTASAETRWMNGWSTAATFEGEFSNVTRSYAGKGVARYAW